MIKFEIKNFQSITHAVVELENFVVFQGASNRGKTAVIRALKAILYNDWHPSMMSKDAKQTDLILTFPHDTHNVYQIHLVKSKTKNEYTIKHRDGSSDGFYPKVGLEVPQEVQDLNFELIVTEREDKFNMNFQTQLEPLFLVGERSDFLVTSFFNKIFDIARFEKALKNITTDSIALNREHTIKTVDLDNAKNNVLDLERQAKVVRAKHEEISTVYAAFIEKEKAIALLDKTIQLQEELFTDRDNLGAVEALAIILGKYFESYHNINVLATTETNLLSTISGLKESKEHLTSLSSFQSEFETYVDLGIRINEIIEDELGIEAAKKALSDLNTLQDGTTSLAEMLSEEIHILGKILSISGILKQLEDADKEFVQIQESKDTWLKAAMEISDIEDQFKEWTQRCSLCNQPFEHCESHP